MVSTCLRLALALGILAVLSSSIWMLGSTVDLSLLTLDLPSSRPGPTKNDSGTVDAHDVLYLNITHPWGLGIASKIYVVSLPHRTDRRATMERLRKALSLAWAYVDAVQSNDSGIYNIMDHVRTLRETSATPHGESGPNLGDNPLAHDRFDWMNNTHLDSLVHSHESLRLAGSDLWTTPFPKFLDVSDSSHPLPGVTNSTEMTSASDLPLTCATENYISGSPYSPSLPAYMLLTAAKIACWYSHLEVIRQIAQSGSAQTSRPDNGPIELERGSDTSKKRADSDEVSVVLEDDVDMEQDIRERLLRVWHILPTDWDIVFLGHCWSNESFYPPLAHAEYAHDAASSDGTSLHPSFAPKCTHAYALTRTGARRLLLHLRHPPFAYSRAFDQALSWLVSSGRLKAFSVVPSVVVQQKVVGSDVDPGAHGKGSAWREHLQNGVLGS